MTSRIAALIAAAFLLSACSDQDWNHALSFAGLGGSKQASTPAAQPRATTLAAAPAPAPAQAAGAAPQPNQFCASVASGDANGNDFDPATQQRVFIQSYQQCVAVFGDVTK